jgi:predicted dehydrogenase
MFDMGPYYLTALVHLIGPMRRVTGSARTTFPERTITSEPKRGAKITVQVPTHVAGIIDFENGAVGTIVTTFDVWASQLPRMEIYGTEGTLSAPDPNTFGGPVYVRRSDEKEWREVSLTHLYAGQSRGVGAADMAYAIRTGRPFRASGDLAYHVLDAMCAFHEASDQGRHIELESAPARPVPLPPGLTEGVLDA